VLGDQPLAARTPLSITDPARLRRELAPVRERGYAENVGESSSDMASVAAPIHGEAGHTTAAISVSGPLSRMGESVRRRYVTAILDTAARISEQLGYRRPQQPRKRSA
jgi:DNA-binding IclR family transcriptional regulator